MSADTRKDFIGKEIVVNDFVVFTRPKYRDLVLGKVVKITPKQIRVEFKTHYGTTDTHALPSTATVKVEGPELTLFLLKRDTAK